MEVNRVWAMPSKWTFTIRPIATLLRREKANLVGMLEKVRAEIAQWEGV